MERYQEISRAFKQAPWRRQLQFAAAALLALVAVAAVGGLYLATTSRWATAGRELQELQVRKAELEIENNELRKTLAALRTSTRLYVRANELGFVPATNEQVEYLVVDGYPGKGVTTGLAGKPAVPELEVTRVRYDETLVDWVARVLAGPSAEASGGG